MALDLEKKIPGKSGKMAKFWENGDFDSKHNLFGLMKKETKKLFPNVKNSVSMINWIMVGRNPFLPSGSEWVNPIYII